jgi:phosphohistidine phosphatase
VQLLVIRHAIAVDRDEFAKSGKDDDLRPLTDTGRRKMRRIAKGLRRQSGKPDVLAASPLTRAQQTAKIIADVYGIASVETIDALRPEARYPALVHWLAEHDESESVAIVGHEPHLSGFVSFLIAGNTNGCVQLKKGGACLIGFDRAPQKAIGTLEWLLTPAQLVDLVD